MSAPLLLGICWAPERKMFVAVGSHSQDRVLTFDDSLDLTWTSLEVFSRQSETPSLGETVKIDSGTVYGGNLATFNGSKFLQLSDILPISSGGTGQTSKKAAFDALSPTTTKGDLIVSDGTNNIRFPVGSDGQVLTAASGQTSGLQWISSLVNPMTTPGDMIVGGTDGVATRLAGGIDLFTPIGTIVAYNPGYYGNGSNGSFTLVGPSTNNVAGVNAFLPDCWRVCDGSELNDADSPIFNGSGRHLPNITGNRFLMGTTAAGSVGGNASNQVTLTTSQLPSHSHPAGTLVANTANAPHSHPGSSASTGVADAAHSHTFGGGGNIAVGNAPVQTVGNGGTQVGGTVWSASAHTSTAHNSAPHSHPASVSIATDNAPHGHTISGSSGPVGDGTAFSILPQYLTTFYIMRVK